MVAAWLITAGLFESGLLRSLAIAAEMQEQFTKSNDKLAEHFKKLWQYGEGRATAEMWRASYLGPAVPSGGRQEELTRRNPAVHVAPLQLEDIASALHCLFKAWGVSWAC